MNFLPENAATRPRAGFWIWVAPALLLLQVGVCSITVYLALSDRSFATEPDYYRKALNWDAAAAERRATDALGWHVQTDVSSIESPLHERTVRVILTDRSSAPIVGADIRAELFPHARAMERNEVEFKQQGPGVYDAVTPMARSGVWEVRLHIKANDQTAALTRLIDVAPAGGVQP